MRTQVSTRDDLLAERLPKIGWFPERLAQDERMACRGLAASEVVFRHEATEIVSDPWPYAVATLRRLSARSGWDCIVLAVDPLAAPSSAVRARLPPQRLRECLRGVPSSIAEVRAGTEGIVMAVGVSLQDIADDAVHALLANCRLGFAAVGDSAVVTFPRVTAVLAQNLDVKGSVWIDYMKLIPVLCPEGAVIATFDASMEAALQMRLFGRKELILDNSAPRTS